MNEVFSKLGLPRAASEGSSPVKLAGCGSQGFLAGLYREHLDEASFLYMQRRVLLHDREVGWPDLFDFESRFEAHVDALIVGEDLALSVCRTRASALDGDCGELHTIARVFCRQHRFDLLEELLRSLDFTDPDRIGAVADALRDELSQEQQVDLLSSFETMPPPMFLATAKCVQFRRQNLDVSAESGVVSLLEMVAERLSTLEAMDTQMSELLHHGAPDVRTFRALASLTRGDAGALAEAQQAIEDEAWAVFPMCVSGSQSDFDKLVPSLSVQASEIGTLALGWFGDVRGVDALIPLLSQHGVSAHAALALHLLTGAPLVEEASITEPVDRDTLFPHELERFHRGEWEPRQMVVRRLSECPRAWQTWWDENRQRFDPALRYRCGVPCSPAVLYDLMRGVTTPNRIRQWAYEELVIRHNLDLPFDTELFVERQMVLLDRIGDWVLEHEPRAEAGKWYFAGAPV